MLGGKFVKKRKVQISHPPEEHKSNAQLQGQQKQSNLYATPFLNTPPPPSGFTWIGALKICINSLFCMHMSTKQIESYFDLNSKMIQIS